MTCPSLEQMELFKIMELFDIRGYVSFSTSLALAAKWLS
jgi:hypothetical protein